MAGRSNSRANVILRFLNMIAGLQKHLAGQSLVLGGKTFLVADVITALQNYIAQLNAASAAQAAWHTQVLAVETLEASEINAMEANLGHCLEGMYGEGAGILAEFGLTPRKPAKRSVASKNEAVEKNLATREARQTKGPRQKEDIHGTVPAKPTTGNNPGSKSG